VQKHIDPASGVVKSIPYTRGCVVSSVVLIQPGWGGGGVDYYCLCSVGVGEGLAGHSVKHYTMPRDDEMPD
jgi:hypothetical protein